MPSRIALVVLLVALALQGTTLVVFYDPKHGAILATDSSISETNAVGFQSGRKMTAASSCKIHACGRYFVASAGIWGSIRGRDTAAICQDQGKNSVSIDEFVRSFEPSLVEVANVFVNDLVIRKQPPKINQHMFSLAVVGFEQGKPVLRYREVRYTGSSNRRANFKVTMKIACPGSPECEDLREVTGLFEAIAPAKQRGRYANITDPLALAESLVQTEIEAHRSTGLVLPPISVLQVNGPTPKWYRGGMCVTPQ